MKHRVLFLCTLLVLAVGPALGQTFTGRPERNNGLSTTIAGSVSTVDGKAVGNARIEVRQLGTGVVVTSGYTLPNGTFEFDNIPPGHYEVVAVAGLQEARQDLEADSWISQVTLRIGPQDSDGNSGNHDTVSVAEMKVPDKARKAVHKAEESFAKRKLEEARRETDKALEIAPTYARALTMRGILDLNDNNTDKARQELEAAVKFDPGFGMSYVVLGAVYNALSRYDDAVRSLNHGITAIPNSWQAHFEYAKALLGKGQFEGALREVNKAAQFAAANYPALHLVRAHVMLGLKNYNDAVMELEQYLGGEPNGVDASGARQTLNQVRAFMASSKGK